MPVGLRVVRRRDLMRNVQVVAPGFEGATKLGASVRANGAWEA